jgi:hypothetical protein
VKKQIKIGAKAFKATCLEVLLGLERHAYARVIVTRRGKPIAELIAPRTATPRLWGPLRGSITVAPGVDLTEPALAEPLDSERGFLAP